MKKRVAVLGATGSIGKSALDVIARRKDDFEVVLLSAYIGFAIWNVSHTQIETGIPKNAIPVEIESSHIETIVCKVSIKGTVELINVETVFPKSSATIDTVYVKEGDEVLAGQVLVDYDSKTLEDLQDLLTEAKLSLRQATLSLTAAETASAGPDKRRLENADISYDNAKTLYEAGVISQQELAAASEAKISAEEQVENNLRQISILQVTIEQNNLKISQIQKEIDHYSPSEYAPISGTIFASYVKKGDIVTAGRQLFDIADVSQDNLTIVTIVPENDARNLALEQDVEIRCNAIGPAVFTGKVCKISPFATKQQIGNSSETALTLEIRSVDAPLKAGYTIEATIITKIIEDAVVVPLMSTVRETDGANYVYIMNDDYSVEKRLVELGEYAGVYVETSNIKLGEKIILNPSSQISAEVFVKPVVIH